MANITDVHSIIVSADAPNLTAHTYNEIYGGASGCTMVLNGVTVIMAAQSNIKIWVRTISGGSGCYLLGEKQNVLQGITNGYYLGD
jgi:hypothetical protein